MQNEEQAVEVNYSGRSEPSKIVMKPFRLMTSSEKYTIEHLIQKQSGLHRNQFASNPWGFPFIPLPYPRRGHQGVPRMAPEEVNDVWLGHPIYWIEPKLTYYDPMMEEEAAWCMRMFYLIQSMGLWSDSLQWRSMTAEVEYDDIDIQTYHQSAAPRSNLDQIKILTEEDMETSVEEYLNNYASTMGKCAESLVTENEALINRQTEAYQLSKQITASDSSEIGIRALRADESGSLWTTTVSPGIMHVTATYESRMESGSGMAKLSDLVPDIRTYFNHAEEVIKRMNHVSSILTIPVLKSINPNPESFGYLASYIGVAVDAVANRNNSYDFTERALNTTSRDLRPGALRDVVSDTWEEFQKAWKRVLMSMYNFERIQENEAPFTTFSSLEVHYNIQRNAGRQDMSANDRVRQFDKIFGEMG